MCDVCHCSVDRSRAEVYNHPKPWKEFHKPISGFKYDTVPPFFRPIEGLKPTPGEQAIRDAIVTQTKEEKFYGVGCRTWWYQWNEPDKN